MRAHRLIPPPPPPTAQFVLFLGYMPIISSSLRVLDCTPPLDGVRYLRSDLRVPCGVGEHAAAAVFAFCVLLSLGLGFPAVLGWMLSTASPEALAQPSFQGAWGFLIGGYRTSDGEAQRVAEIAAALVEAREGSEKEAAGDGSSGSPAPRRSEQRSSLLAAAAHTLATVKAARASAMPLPPAAGSVGAAPSERLQWHDAVLERYCTWRPQRLLWWESVVMVRKAGIVLLAVLVTNPWFQCAGAAILLGAALVAHQQYQPYAERLFNLLETASLAAAALTAVIAATLLQYDVTAPEYASQPPAAMTATQWAVTVVLGAVNLGTFALLAAAWLYLTAQAARKSVKVLRAGRGSKAPPASSGEWEDGGGGVMFTNPALRLGGRVRGARRSTFASLAVPAADHTTQTAAPPAAASDGSGSVRVVRLGGEGAGGDVAAHANPLAAVPAGTNSQASGVVRPAAEAATAGTADSSSRSGSRGDRLGVRDAGGGAGGAGGGDRVDLAPASVGGSGGGGGRNGRARGGAGGGDY
jgi:hypothetical protein